MVCGNVVASYTESTTEASMGTLKLTFKVMTMDKNGHITWPTDFEPGTMAALRMQVRKLQLTTHPQPLTVYTYHLPLTIMISYIGRNA